LQQITIRDLGRGRKYSDGEDPDEEGAAETAHCTSHDIGITSNFSKLREFYIDGTVLNGRYPFLFNSFPLLQKLDISFGKYLKWDLEMLAGLPVLKELHCHGNPCLTGNISSLRVLRDTLEKVTTRFCSNVEGNFMDLADFPHLKELDLDCTAVTGDIRDTSENDFSSLEKLTLPRGVYGGLVCEIQRISDAPDLMRSVNLFYKQRPALKMGFWCGKLSVGSPDWYELRNVYFTPPFCIKLVQAGSRAGYRWEASYHGRTPHANCKFCGEVNWLDPEPDPESDGYENYTEELEEINSKVHFYKGFHQPPTEEEYNQLCGRLDEEGDWW
jgi:hypothetical protein